MPTAKHLTLETVNFGHPEEVDAFLKEVMDEGMRRIKTEGDELLAEGLMDASGKLLTDEVPPDMREGSERDFGG